jgi:hypothetical protein
LAASRHETGSIADLAGYTFDSADQKDLEAVKQSLYTMMNKKYFFVAGFIIVFTIIFAQGVYSQALKEADTTAPRYVVLNHDIETYQIICEPYVDDKDYIQYGQLIREKIKQRLDSANIRYYKQGDVNLFFKLKFDGSLVEFKAMPDSTKDKRLIDIVVSCVKKASPFPPFPKTLSLPQASFCVVISFKEHI